MACAHSLLDYFHQLYNKRSYSWWIAWCDGARNMLYCNQQRKSSLIYPCTPGAVGLTASTEASIYIYIR